MARPYSTPDLSINFARFAPPDYILGDRGGHCARQQGTIVPKSTNTDLRASP